MLVVGSLIRQLLTPRISNNKTDIVDSIHLPTTVLHICYCASSRDYFKTSFIIISFYYIRFEGLRFIRSR